MSKLFIISAIFVVLVSSTVFAAMPNNQACLGKDISGYTQGGTEFGGFISGLARSTGVDGQQGVGGEFQAHLAGNVPDEVIPNSCND